MYRHFGVMLDVSRNAVMQVSQVKKFIDCLEKMGYNALELYAEDTYKIESEPFFGYMRGGYSGEELREIDDYAKAHGVELIPCVQTLAHFTNLVKIPKYHPIVDAADILLIDEPQTYELIEKIIATAAENFSSRHINIGMDEAFMVGLGKYLAKHGYHNRFEILLGHLNKVSAIAAKYGFTCHMWSDMFFRLCNDGKYCVKGAKVEAEVAKKIPQNVELAYWDYYNQDGELYDDMLSAHQGFGKNVWFAGGAWSWNGFAPMNGFTLATMKPAMESVRKHAVKDVLITMWGDNGKECSFFGLLPSLYAVRQYAEGNFDERSIKEGFERTFGYSFDGFMTLDLPNTVTYADEVKNHNACKSLLYSDPFVGRIEKDIESFAFVDYASATKRLKSRAKSAGEFAYLFETMAALCATLEIKKDLGVRTRRAYRAKDREEILRIAKDYGLCRIRLQRFYKRFRALWLRENKPFGWEVQDARLGGLTQRLCCCQERLQDFAEGKIGKIEELEEEALQYLEEPSLQCNDYRCLVSPSEV